MGKFEKQSAFSPAAQKLNTTVSSSSSSGNNAAPVFGSQIAKDTADVRDNSLARDDVVYVKRADREKILNKSTKEYNDFVGVMTTPTFPERFSYVDLTNLTNPQSVLTNSTSIARMLELIRSHLVRYDLIIFLKKYLYSILPPIPITP